jgi:hypothetical protein
MVGVAVCVMLQEFEKPPPDDIFGTRIHSWVVILPTSMDIQEPFFINPLTGNKCDLSNPNYLGLESMWNHSNYWANLQSCSEGCKVCGDLQFQEELYYSVVNDFLGITDI